MGLLWAVCMHLFVCREMQVVAVGYPVAHGCQVAGVSWALLYGEANTVQCSL